MRVRMTAFAACLMFGGLSGNSGASPSDGPAAAPQQDGAQGEGEKEGKDTVYEEGYAYGLQQGENFRKAGIGPGSDAIILPSGLIKIMMQRVGPLAYERWEKGYLKGFRDGRAGGSAPRGAPTDAPEKRPQPEENGQTSSPRKAPRKPAPEGFGPLRLGMKRTEAHAAISSWNLRDAVEGTAFARWEGMPVKDVWRFGVLFSDGYDLWSVTEGSAQHRLAQPGEIPGDYRDAHLIEIRINYFKDDHVSWPSDSVKQAFFARLRSVYGDPDHFFEWAFSGENAAWLWPREDRYARWEATYSQLKIGTGALAKSAVRLATQSLEHGWQSEKTKEALAALESAVAGGTPADTPGAPASPPAAPEDKRGRICGSWRVRGHGVESGRFEGSLSLKPSERTGEVVGELVWSKGKFKGRAPAYRTRVRGTVHTETVSLGAVGERTFRVLALLTDEFPDDDRTSGRPPLIYAAVLENDHELRWGTTSWSTDGGFSWEATRTPDGEADDGLPQEETNSPTRQEEDPTARHLQEARKRLAAGEFQEAGEAANAAIAASPRNAAAYAQRARIFSDYGDYLVRLGYGDRAPQYFRLALEDYDCAIMDAPEPEKVTWRLARGFAECAIAATAKEREAFARILSFAREVLADAQAAHAHHLAWELAG